MPRAKNPTLNDLLSLLPIARRKEIINEAMGAQARVIFDSHRGATVGSLVDALRKSRSWGLLKDVHVSTVMGGPAPRPASRPNGGATAAAPRRRRRGVQPGVLDRVVSFVAKNPGLRSEQIQAKLGGDHDTVKKALAKLRDIKRVKTTGEKRATTYTAA